MARTLHVSALTALSLVLLATLPARADRLPDAPPSPAGPPMEPPPRPPRDATPAAAPPREPPPVVPFVGHVLKRGDRTPIAGASIILDEQALDTTTDATGAFSFDAVPVGKHKIHVRGANVLPADVDETLVSGKRFDVTYYVNLKERYASTVRGAPVVREVAEQQLSGDELRKIPGTQGDTLKAIQNLAGVARAPFGIGLLVVWGSAPLDTRVYADGVYIPTLYHFGGLRSTVNGEMVEGLKFFPGGYGVEYGRGLGGVVEIESRRPKTNGYHGFVQLDLIDGSLSLEGPITKDISLAIAARRSWIDVFLPLFTTNDFQLSPKYWDYQARLYWKASPRDDVDLFVFGSDDSIELLANNADPTLVASVASHTFYHRGILRWLHRLPGRATVQVTGSVGYDVPFQFTASIGNIKLNVDASTLSYSLRAVTRVPLGRHLRLDAGVDFEGNRWGIAADAPTGGAPREGDMMGMPGGAFGHENLTLYIHGTAPFVSVFFYLLDRKLTIVPSLRLELFSFSGSEQYSVGVKTDSPGFSHFYAELEPRLSARWQANDWLAFKGSMGVYHQAPDPASFLFLGGNPGLAPELGMHYVAGIELKPTSTLTIEAEGFYKDLRNLVVRAQADSLTGRAATFGSVLTNEGLGRVYGVEAIIRQEIWKNFFGWIVYTLSQSERRDHPGEDWRLFQYDQTHILTLIASYRFPYGYQLGVRFRYVTGNPVTPIVGAWADLNTDNYHQVQGPLFSSRLDAFHQLDVRFDKTWTYRLWRLGVYLDIQNVYNNASPEAVTYNFNATKSKPLAGLPFLPVFGIRGDF